MADCHLVLAYRPGWQSFSDLSEIARHVADIDAGVRTFIVRCDLRKPLVARVAGQRPTLVVSTSPLLEFAPARGKIYQGAIVPKFEQVRRLQAAGIPVPRTALLTPDLRLDPAEWGEFVILKPDDLAVSSHGVGISVMRTARVRFRPPEEYPEGHPGRFAPMMVQEYVHTGEHLEVHRVLTLFGQPLYSMRMRSVIPGVDLSAPDEVLEQARVAHQSDDDRQRFMSNDPNVLALAMQADRALPDVPLKGCDVIRDVRTGRLYVLELNPGGNTWHFSSGHGAEMRRRLGPAGVAAMRMQMDALRTAARVLVARTRAEAV